MKRKKKEKLSQQHLRESFQKRHNRVKFWFCGNHHDPHSGRCKEKIKIERVGGDWGQSAAGRERSLETRGHVGGIC